MLRREMTEESSYTCPACGMTSYHPEDVRHEYCGNCHKTRSEVEAGSKKPRIIRLEDLSKEDKGDGVALVTAGCGRLFGHGDGGTWRGRENVVFERVPGFDQTSR